MPARQFNHFLNKEINELYISSAIRTLALAVVNIFVPLFLLSKGYSITQILLFFFAMNVAHALTVIPAAFFSVKFGIKHTIMISLPFMFIYFVMLYNIDTWPFYLVPIVYGISKGFYWFGYHLNFSKFCDKDKKGKEISQAKLIIAIMHVIGPTIGGVVLALVGFKALFVVVAVLTIAVAIPLFYTKDSFDKFTFDIKKIFKQKPTDYLGYMGFGFDDCVRLFVWPLIVFMILGSYTKVGLISSLSLFFSMVTIYIAGKYSDKNNEKTKIVGSNLLSIGWIIRSLASTPMFLYFADSFYGITQSIARISIDVKSYANANKSNRVNYIIFREFSINMFDALLCLIIAFVANLKVGVYVAAFSSLLMMLF